VSYRYRCRDVSCREPRRLIRVETGTLAALRSDEVAPADWTGFAVARTAETAYDAVGRKVRDAVREGAAGPVRAVTQYSYDWIGRLECTAVRMNPAAFGSLPASTCVPGAPAITGLAASMPRTGSTNIDRSPPRPPPATARRASATMPAAI
jgi:hypothetical protein